MMELNQFYQICNFIKCINLFRKLYTNFVYLLFLCSKDVRLPQQLQRAMAAEAEATREARAKVR